MRLFSKKKVTTPSDEQSGHITQSLYKQNVELAIKNKTLSLLRQLYQISILTLEPKALAEALVKTIANSLGFELVAIYTYVSEIGTLEPLAYSITGKWESVVNKRNSNPLTFKIQNIQTSPFLQPIITNRIKGNAEHLSMIWGSVVTRDILETLERESNVKSSLVFPLVIEGKVTGLLICSLNRSYKELPQYEKESIESFINVIAIALDRASLYEKLASANEKLKSLDLLKTEFLSLASHQLRSPLTAITGYTSMLLDGSFGTVNEKQNEAIDRVYKSSRHLTNIVEDLLNVTKIEQGGMSYIMNPFDLTAVVQALVNDLSITAQKKGLQLTFNGESNILINADMEKLRQVVLNLIDNAIKYTEKGEIVVSLSKTPLDEILLSVKDSGAGVPADIIPTLFQKFSRGEGGRMNTGGSGLGLYLAKEIVEAHKGSIWLESKGRGQGSTFFIKLQLYHQVNTH